MQHSVLGRDDCFDNRSSSSSSSSSSSELLVAPVAPIIGESKKSKQSSMKLPAAELDLPPIESWPNRPIFVRRALSSNASLQDRKKLLEPCVIHQDSDASSIIHLNNNLFEGKMLLIVKGIKGEPCNYFDSKKRQFEIVVQGYFKSDTPGNRLYTGQCFDRHIDIKHPWIVNSILYLIRSFIGDIQVEAKANKQFILSPVLTTTQKIHASKTGFEPDMMSIDDVGEDISIHGDAFKEMTPEDRKAYFAINSHIDEFIFKKDICYTFVSYQHLVSFATFDFLLAGVKVNISSIIGRNPLQIMAVYFDSEDRKNNPDQDWRFFYNVEVWHERSVSVEERKSECAGGGWLW